jgi:hypothetical protein
VFISLVAIGVGTALRIDGYDARKLLMKLLGVALLINFVPLLCGVVIDITNILMNFFFNGGMSGMEFLKTQSKMSSATFTGLWNSTDSGTSLLMGLIVATILLCTFNVLTAIVFLLFAVLFLMRYIALWILVIIAPLMFAFMVLPATKKWWQSWLDKFTNWCFVGTIAAFYLYLSQQMVALISQGSLIGSTGPDTKDLGMVEYLLSAFVPVAFLYFGFFEALSGSALGSGAVVNMAKGGARRIGSGTRRTAGRAIGSGAKRTGKEMAKSSPAGRMTRGLAGASKWGQDKKTLTGWFQRTAGGVVTAVGGEKAGTKMADARDKLMKENDEKVAKMTGREYAYELDHKALGLADKGSFIARGLESKDPDVKKAATEKLKSMSQDNYLRMVKEMQTEGNDKDADKLSLAGRSLKNYQPENIGLKAFDPKMKEWAGNLSKAEEMQESWASSGFNSYDLKKWEKGGAKESDLKEMWMKNNIGAKQKEEWADQKLSSKQIEENKENMWNNSGVRSGEVKAWVENLSKSEKLDEKWEKSGWKAEEVKEWVDKKWENQTEKMMDGAKKEDIANFSSGFWKSKEASEGIMKFWGGEKISEAAKNFGDSFVKNYSDKAAEKGPEWLAKNNAKAFVYLASNPAQEAGFNVPGGYAKVEDVRKFINDEKKKGGGTGPTATPPPASPASQAAAMKKAGFVVSKGSGTRPVSESDFQQPKESEAGRQEREQRAAAEQSMKAREELNRKETSSRLKFDQEMSKRAVEKAAEKYKMPKGGEMGPRGTSKKPPGGEMGV